MSVSSFDDAAFSLEIASSAARDLHAKFMKEHMVWLHDALKMMCFPNPRVQLDVMYSMHEPCVRYVFNTCDVLEPHRYRYRFIVSVFSEDGHQDLVSMIGARLRLAFREFAREMVNTGKYTGNSFNHPHFRVEWIPL